MSEKLAEIEAQEKENAGYADDLAETLTEFLPDLTEEEINQFCMALPRYKRPRKIILADVPRNATGKIEKPKLREKYCGGRLVEKQTTK